MENGNTSWQLAVELVERFNKQAPRLSHLMERLPSDLDPGTRRACQSLLFGTVRQIRLLEKALDGLMRKRPKPGLWAALLVASYELLQSPDKSAKVVHHAVERVGKRYSRPEKGLANAVLRKVPDRLEALLAERSDSAAELAWRFSHPVWRVEDWLSCFGLESTRRLLEWNQQEPTLYGRWQGRAEEVACLQPSEWEGFFRVAKGDWKTLDGLLESGRIYIQNPATRHAPRKLAQRVSSGRVLDLCAAPGGKSLLLHHGLAAAVERILALDLPGPRFERMESNFRRYGVGRIEARSADLLELDPQEIGSFEGVLLDVPCSNSGVLQHKVDARWRVGLKEAAALPALQLQLLARASALVKAGGWLVYSTCSIDGRENEGVAEAFLASEDGTDFCIEKATTYLPWEVGHDGAGVIALRRSLP